eukprot:COSAG01_NODE_3090_length_6601_cov_5.372347_3_plen_145_part_00
MPPMVSSLYPEDWNMPKCGQGPSVPPQVPTTRWQLSWRQASKRPRLTQRPLWVSVHGPLALAKYGMPDTAPCASREAVALAPLAPSSRCPAVVRCVSCTSPGKAPVAVPSVVPCASARVTPPPPKLAWPAENAMSRTTASTYPY